MLKRLFLPLLLVLSVLFPGGAGAVSGPSLPKPTLSVTAAPGVVLPPVGTFSRTCTVPGTASYTDLTGKIAYSSDNLLRPDYDPITHDFLGWLIEGSRANLWPYSSDATQTSYWFSSAGTVSSATMTAPDGATQCSRLMETAVSDQHYVGQNFSGYSLGTTFTYSVFIKTAGRSQVALTFWGAGYAVFDVSAGTVVQNGGFTTSIKAYPNGWYRCSITGNFVNTGLENVYVLGWNGSNSYLGDVSKGFYLWGAMLEAGSFASSYIPTTTASNVRGNDLWTVPDTNLHGAEATLYADFDIYALSSGAVYSCPMMLGSWGTGGRWMMLTYGASVQSTYSYNLAAPVALYPGTIAAGQRGKQAFSLKSGAFASAFNGGVVQTSVYETLAQPAPATVTLGSDGYGFLFGHLKQAAIYPTALSNAQLQTLTGSDPAHLAYPTLSLISDPNTQPTIGTYTRNSVATFVGSNGLIQTAPAGTLRYDYSPTVVDSNTGTLKGLGWLFEESRTNLLTYSEQFDNAAWSRSGAGSVSPNAAIAPDGTITMDLLTDTDTVADSTFWNQTKTVSNDSSSYTFSVYLRQGSAPQTTVAGYCIGGSTTAFYGVVTWANKTIDYGKLVDCGNGVYRASILITNNSSGNTSLIARIYPSTTAPSTTGTVYAWGAMLEQGAFPTSYIPTVASTYQRQADSWMILVSSFPFNAAEGTLFAWGDTFQPNNLLQGGTLASLYSAASDTLGMTFGWNTGYGPYVYAAGATRLGQVVGFVPNTAYKMAARYKAGDYAGRVGGANPSSTTYGVVPVWISMYVGYNLNGHLIMLQYVPRGDSNADLQLRTSALDMGEHEYAMAA